MDKGIKLSIIVPVYNVESYIRPCIESIFTQGLNTNDFELILINDGTQDNSFAQISDILQDNSNVFVIEQSNQGLSAARNTGMKYAKGEYILFVDSDDLLAPYTLPSLIISAIDSRADILIADYQSMTDGEISKRLPVEQLQGDSEAKYGSDIFLEFLELRECYVWRTLYRRDFLERNNLSFIKGIYFEDIVFTTNCYLKAAHAVRVHKVFYIYRQRSDSIVSTINKKKIFDLNFSIAQLWALKKDVHFSKSVRLKLADMAFCYFSLTIWYISHERTLFADRHELVKNLLELIPDLRFFQGCKQSFITIVFRLMPSNYVWIRSLIR